MKKVLLLCLLSLNALSQTPPIVYIWQVRPATAICPGDTILVNFKFNKPSTPDQTVNYFNIDNNIAWQGNWSILAACPQELWMGGPQWTYLLKIVTSTVLTVGTHTVFTPNTSPNYSVQSFAVKNCSCTITSGFTFTNADLVAELTSNATGTTSATKFYWDFGITSGWQQGAANQTFTYTSPGTYSIGHMVANPTCTDIVFHQVTVTQATVDITGIREYSMNQPLEYFDLYGNKIAPRTNEIIIEQRGVIRRKVLISGN